MNESCTADRYNHDHNQQHKCFDWFDSIHTKNQFSFIYALCYAYAYTIHRIFDSDWNAFQVTDDNVQILRAVKSHVGPFILNTYEY